MTTLESNTSGERLMVAHLVDPIEEGYNFTDWPLHITVLPWFKRSESITKSEIELSAEHMRACRVALGKKALGCIEMFGDECDTPVRTISNSTSLGVMHGMLLTMFRKNLESTDYIGGAYNPHLTIRENNDPGELAEIDIDRISLIKYENSVKTVLRNYDLKNETKT